MLDNITWQIGPSYYNIHISGTHFHCTLMNSRMYWDWPRLQSNYGWVIKVSLKWCSIVFKCYFQDTSNEEEEDLEVMELRLAALASAAQANHNAQAQVQASITPVTRQHSTASSQRKPRSSGTAPDRSGMWQSLLVSIIHVYSSHLYTFMQWFETLIFVCGLLSTAYCIYEVF